MVSITYDDEVVPDAEQFPHVEGAGLVLHRLGEQRDEVGRAEVGAVHRFFFQMAVQVGQHHRDQPVESVEVELEHWQLSVEQGAQFEDVDDLSHDGERQSLVLQEQIKEARNEIHSLTVV